MLAAHRVNWSPHCLAKTRRYNAASRIRPSTSSFKVLLFWFLAALLVALTLAALLWPLLRGRFSVSAPEASEATIAVYRDQKRALDAERAAGTITAAEHDSALGELTRRVAEEADVVPAQAPLTPHRAKWIAIALLLLIPAAAIVLYGRLGNPETAAVVASDAGNHEVSEKQIAAMVAGLAARLKQHPDDGNGWVLLAHSYQALERFPEAADAYEHAAALIPNDANLLADYADTLAMAQGRKLAGKPAELVQRALAIDPRHRKALALAGTIALEARDLNGSLAYWRRLAAELPAGSDESRQVASVIAEVESAKQGKGAPLSSQRASSAEEPAAQKSNAKADPAAISGRVDLSAALAPKVALSDTVFIFARAVDGPRMPLAVLRIPAKELPRNFSLDDSMSMAPGAKLSSTASVIVEARISKSGNPIAQSGDLFGRSAPVKPGTAGILITIDEVVP
jgi:cytochrome c-type biogenesis protein CcmH